MEHGPRITALVDDARRTKEALSEKHSNDTQANLERSVAVYCLVRALEEAGVIHAQAEAARLLNVSRTVTNRHVRKVREWIERDPPTA
jgi:predicted transcriptional regulator YheO